MKTTKDKPVKKFELYARQVRFALHYLECQNKTEAAVKAGYTKEYARRIVRKLLKNEQFIALLEEQKNALAERTLATFEAKIKLLWGKALEADDAKDMVSLIAELNKMQGHYAPTQTHNLNVNANIVTDIESIRKEYEKEI